MSAADPLILCASDRLARELRAEHSLAQRRAGREVWEAPAIFSLRQWVLDQWLASWPTQQLLHPVQELILWQEAIEDSASPGRFLLAPRSCAREARRADQLIRAHGLTPRPGAMLSEDQSAFLRWRRQFTSRCRDAGWVVAGDLYPAVAALIQAGALAPPPAIELAGFMAELPAAERRVLEACERAGSQISARPRRCEPALRGWRPADVHEQYRAIAQALHARLLPFADSELPPPRLIVALSDPENDRERAEVAFREALAPWLAQPGGSQALPWRWENGRRLSEQPWVDAALVILRLESYGNAPAAVSRLLLSSTLWEPAERARTAALDHHLRDRGWPQIRFARLLDERRLPPPLLARFQVLQAALRDEPRQAMPSAWLPLLQKRLDALGWPGGAELDSAAYQIVREFQRALARVGALDQQLGPVRRSVAQGWLEEFLRATRLEPRSEHEQPILILRHQDAVGLPCDGLFLADATADTLPGAAPANPFLAWELLAAAGFPEATPQGWLKHRRLQLDALLHAAPEVQIYAPLSDTRGAESLPSPLLPALQWSEPPEPPAAHTGSQAIWPRNDPVPPVVDAATEMRHHDTNLFHAYAEAPFFAFAGWRLGVAELPQPDFGLNSRDQGTVLHAALKSLWDRLHTRDALLALDEAALAEHVEQALAEPFTRRVQAGDFGPGLTRLEHGRLADLLLQWLRHERRRVEPFTAVLREVELHTEFCGLPLSLRVDRVDKVQTAQGPRWLVLDYKAGRRVETRGWKEDSLSEPQLPLYASHALLDQAAIPRVDGICFAHLKDGHPALSAWMNWRERLIADKEKSEHARDWDAKLAAWRGLLEQRARGFLAGDVSLPAAINERSRYAAWLALANAIPVEDEA